MVRNAFTHSIPLPAVDFIFEYGQGLVLPHPVSIGPVGRHSVICVGDGDYAREQWNLVPLKTVRISVAVHAFVVGSNYAEALFETFQWITYIEPESRVAFNGTSPRL